MTPLTEWLKPPRTLLLLLFLLTLVSVSALGWFGWKLLGQERAVEAQRSQERVEAVADRIAATVRGTLAETGDRLGSWESAQRTGPSSNQPSNQLSNQPSRQPSSFPAAGGILLRLKENSLAATPAGQLLYYPFPSTESEADPTAFAEAEFLEFVQGQPNKALESYGRQANSPNASAAVRAGAMLRMARVLRNAGRLEESRIVYARLAVVTAARVAGAPPDLVARHALCELSAQTASQHAAAHELQADLVRGRWHLTRGQFQYYWAEASRLSGQNDQPPPDAIAFSEVAALVWNMLQNRPGARGQETIWVLDIPYLLVWRGTPEERAVLVTKPESILGDGVKQTLADEQILWEMVDGEGHSIAGNNNAGNTSAGHKSVSGRAAVRTSAETQLPWTLYITAAQRPGPSGSAAGMTAPQRFLLLGILVMVLFLIFGTYFIARAIRREAETLRMQSAFVSAVSHEFRSPLTSLRQMSEILALGRVPSEERRQLYYETLVGETTRLQRLIESLLNFGKMEAGARRYHFETLDATVLVRRVASEFEPHIAGLGRRIELQGTPSRCMIEADPDAICVALRNLLDNALKYSPDHPVVWVEWGVRNEHVAIAVRDQGPGIADSEKKAIFRKFVRGSAAAATRASGSGVGLAMVRYIVEAHGGDITVASEPGQGSTFTLFLPALERA
jgi:signal transduction histidine kinase